MGSQNLQPETLEERLIYVTIVATWGFWLAGMLYIVGAAFGYVLVAIAFGRWLGLDEDVREVHAVPATVWAWLAGMLAMAGALVIAHLDFELGIGQTIKSFVGWMKGWALLAIYPLAGALLRVRPQIIARATGILAVQTVVLAPLFLAAELVGLPAVVYVSPVHNLVGAGSEFLGWARELDLPDPEAVLADPASFVLPERGDRAYAALSSVAAAVMADPTLARWYAGWKVLGSAGERAPDVAAVAARLLARCRPPGATAPPEIKAFLPLLRDAGMLGEAGAASR